MADKFNKKFGDWVEYIDDYLDEPDMQESLFDLRETIEDTGMSERDKILLSALSSSILKLSFILKENREKTERFYKYLQEC